jgi:hypothetical protein
MNGGSKKMTTGSQCLSRQFAVFVAALMMWPFLSRAQVALDQARDTGAITPTKPAVGQPAGIAGKPDELKVSLTLKDGSQIIGTPVFKALTVITPYGKMEARVEMLESIRFTSGDEKVNMTFRNGDTLSGSLGIHEFEINTIFGKIRVTTDVVVSMEVLIGGAGLDSALLKGLVLHFSFDRDENGKVTDKSGKGNNGTIHNAMWLPKGKLGGAYGFDAVNGYIDVPDSPSMDLANLTISAWIYITDRTGNDMCIAEKGPHLESWDFQVQRGGQVGHNYLILRGGSITALFGAQNLSTGVWHHAVGTIAGAYATIYVDGVLDRAGDVTPVGVTSSDLYVGMSYSPQACFGGQMDEVMIFDRALSAEEVKKLYDSQR